MVTRSMEAAIRETERRRAIQQAYNEAHGIVPKTIIKAVRDVIEISKKDTDDVKKYKRLSREKKAEMINKLTKEMRQAAQLLEFEQAAFLRDKIEQLKSLK